MCDVGPAPTTLLHTTVYMAKRRKVDVGEVRPWYVLSAMFLGRAVTRTSHAWWPDLTQWPSWEAKNISVDWFQHWFAVLGSDLCACSRKITNWTWCKVVFYTQTTAGPVMMENVFGANAFDVTINTLAQFQCPPSGPKPWTHTDVVDVTW